MILRTTASRKTPTPHGAGSPREYADPLPVQHPHAAGIDVGDASHWVCDGDATREFPAHTPGLRELEVRHRTERAFHRRAKELGYEVKKVEPAAAAEAEAPVEQT